VNLMSITAKAIDMAVPISTASHLRFFIFFPTGFFAIDVVSFLLIYFASILFYSIPPGAYVVHKLSCTLLYYHFQIFVSLRFIYLHALFLIVRAAYGNSQVYTKVVRNVNMGRYNHSGSPGLRSLKSTA
jgi:hypothetical protein